MPEVRLDLPAHQLPSPLCRFVIKVYSSQWLTKCGKGARGHVVPGNTNFSFLGAGRLMFFLLRR